MRLALCAALVASLTPALTSAAAGAASLPQIGRYKGQTGDGHVFQFSVERTHKANAPRKITHFWLVYDIADCRSGPVRQPFFASVFKTPASPHGAFSRTIPKSRSSRRLRAPVRPSCDRPACSSSRNFSATTSRLGSASR